MAHPGVEAEKTDFFVFHFAHRKQFQRLSKLALLYHRLFLHSSAPCHLNFTHRAHRTQQQESGNKLHNHIFRLTQKLERVAPLRIITRLFLLFF